MSTNLRVARRCDRQQAVLDPLRVAIVWVHAQSWPIDERLDVVRIVKDGQKIRMVVAEWNGRNLRVDIQIDVTVHVNQVIAEALVVIDEELDGVGDLNFLHIGQQFLRRRPRDGRLDGRAGWFTLDQWSSC